MKLSDLCNMRNNATEQQRRNHDKKKELIKHQCMSQKLNSIDLFICQVFNISANEYKLIKNPYDVFSYAKSLTWKMMFQANVKDKTKKLQIIKEKLMELLNAMGSDIANKIVKVIISQLLSLFKTASYFINTHLITENILTQNTYYKTLTSRP